MVNVNYVNVMLMIFVRLLLRKLVKLYIGGLVIVIKEFIKIISCFYNAVNFGICNLRSCIVVSSGKRNSKNCYRLLIWIIRLNLIIKLNSESNISVCIRSDNDLNGAVMVEQSMQLIAVSVNVLVLVFYCEVIFYVLIIINV